MSFFKLPGNCFFSPVFQASSGPGLVGVQLGNARSQGFIEKVAVGLVVHVHVGQPIFLARNPHGREDDVHSLAAPSDGVGLRDLAGENLRADQSSGLEFLGPSGDGSKLETSLRHLLDKMTSQVSGASGNEELHGGDCT